MPSPRPCAPLCASVLAAALVCAPPVAAADILVSLLTDIVLGDVSPTTGELLASTDFCVSLSERGRYTIIASGDGHTGAFEMGSGIDSIPLSLYFTDRPGRRGARLEPGVPLTNLRGQKRRRRGDCRRLNASLQVRIAASDLEAAGAGSYRGVVVLTGAPE